MFYKWIIRASLFVLCSVQLLIRGVQGDEQTDDYIPCNEGWVFFGGKCYNMFGTEDAELNWHDASKRCSELGGHLATIQSKEVQDFLFISQLLKDKRRAWIGLNDIQDEAQYKWDDGTQFNYSNWNMDEPTELNNQDEDCGEMFFRVDKGEPGEWNDRACTDIEPYICQVEEGKHANRSRNPMSCTSAMGNGWKFGNSCYNLVEQNMTWKDAEKYCQDKYEGHLVMTVNILTDSVLRYITSNFSTDFWIGIKMKDQFQQQFSSGWYVAFTNWFENPQNFVDDTCVISTESKRWEIVPCTQKYPFICEVSTDSPPVLNKPPDGSKCPDKPNDWRDLGGEYCYFIDSTNNFKWFKASYECRLRGGSLVNFHSKAELDALSPFVQYPKGQNPNLRISIGMFRTHADENVFAWADGSQFNYTNWSEGEPNNIAEKCGELWIANMKWNDINCEDEKGYICSVRKIHPTVVQTEAHGDCLSRTTFRALIGVTVGIILVVILTPVVIFCFRSWKTKTMRSLPLQTLDSPASQQIHGLSCDECRKRNVEFKSNHPYEYVDSNDGYEFVN